MEIFSNEKLSIMRLFMNFLNMKKFVALCVIYYKNLIVLLVVDYNLIILFFYIRYFILILKLD